MKFKCSTFKFVFYIKYLIVSPKAISILLGLDGLGLASYLLVIYYQSGRAYGAVMFTVLSNRIGDIALLMVITWIINFVS
jgi:NADH-ubiquinone oxidoreductase chain 5